jgi:phage terminase large subunit GpA-like protein
MTSETLLEVRERARRSIIPPARLKLSQWIEQEVKLPSDVSSLPGSIRLYPFQRGMADAMSDAKIERITVVKSARIGYTTLLVGLLGSHVVNEPAPVLFVLPTEDDCRTFVVSNVEPTFEASPCLANVLAGDQGSEKRNTLLSRRFPGGSLKVIAAKAPRNLRAHNARILIMDETDGMEMTKEGSPIPIAERRTMSFPDRKIVIGSTPIYEDSSHVLNAFERSDKRIYEVPCPECGDFHEIEWKDIHWPEGEPEKAHWACPSCGSVIEEKYKGKMVAAGRWRITAPDSVSIRLCRHWKTQHGAFWRKSFWRQRTIRPCCKLSSILCWGKAGVRVARKWTIASLQAALSHSRLICCRKTSSH